ncbi:MAG: type II toxin-antitoxin system RelE/ParE family toxin [Candidatus Aenigmarchaeota archaeon]|nr:type II toxin-antitoxin system RelE/ParE family toxin [Candidatus Aenigmarchaeota archaeon]
MADARIDEILKTLIIDPVPAKSCDVKKLQGMQNTFRIRIGGVRIVYAIVWKSKTILVSRIERGGGMHTIKHDTV